jgi:branched-chain amino acid transport system substrate-binding protein
MRILAALTAATMAVGLAACGSSSDSADTSTSGSAAASTSGGSTTGSHAGAVVKLAVVTDQTGLAAVAGVPELAGVKFAVDQVNASGKLGGAKLEISSTADSATKVPQAVAEVTKAEKSGADVTLLGAITTEALAAAPIAQRAGMPLISMHPAEGLTEVGDHVYNIEPLESSRGPSMADYLKSKGIKRVATLYDSSNPTTALAAEKTIPGQASRGGYEVVSKESFTTTDTDFSGQIAKTIAAKPDAVFVNGIGAANNGVITGLRRAGYTGLIYGTISMGGGAIAGAGKDADGIVYTESFTPSTTDPVGKAFVADYKKATGKAPLYFSAAGNDAVQLVAAAIEKIPGDITRASLNQALTEVTQAGFHGAQGALTFDARQAEAPGYIVEFSGGEEKVVGGAQ